MQKISIFLLLTVTIFDSHSQATYNPSNNQLTIPSVKVGNSTYNNVVITVGNVISIGASNSINDQSLNLKTGWKNLVKSGYTTNFKFTSPDGCNGSRTISLTQPNVTTTFLNKSSYQGTRFVSTSYAITCNLSSSSALTNYYYDLNYDLIGKSVQSTGGLFYVVQTYNIPEFIKVGDTGVVGNSAVYNNSTMTNILQAELYTYQVETYDENNIVFNLRTTVVDYSGVLISATQNKYLVNSSGAVSHYSIITTAGTTTTTYTKQ